MHGAAQHSHLSINAKFLDSNYKIDTLDKEGNTPIQISTWKGYYHVVEFLLIKEHA